MRVYQYREPDGLRRLYRIRPTRSGRFRVQRRGFVRFPLTNEGIRAGREAEKAGVTPFAWYLLDETRTLDHAFAVASIRARESGGGFVPLESRRWKVVAT